MDKFTKHGENSEEIDVKKGIVKLCAEESNYKEIILLINRLTVDERT